MPASKDDIAMKFFELVVARGYLRSTMDDVSKALGISKKTIYAHFSSKEEMLEHALELVARHDRLRLVSLLDDATDLGRILHLMRIVLEEARTFWETSKGTDIVMYGRDMAERAYERAFGGLLHDLVRDGVAAGEFELVDPPTTADLLTAILKEAARRIQSDPPQEPEAAVFEAVRRILSR